MKTNTLHMLLFVSLALLLSAKIGLNLSNPEQAKSLPVSQHIAATRSDASAHSNIKRSTGKTQPASNKAAAYTQPPRSLLAHYSDFLPDVITQAHAARLDTAAKTQAAADDDIFSGLRKQREMLDEKQQQLNEREQAIKAAEEKLNVRITELEQLENTIKQRLQDEKNIKNKKIKRLTAVYEGMKPDRAAPVISKLEIATVVKVFLLMDEKKVGKILSYLPPDKAVQISQALTRRISSLK